jgi:hypothetical protein
VADAVITLDAMGMDWDARLAAVAGYWDARIVCGWAQWEAMILRAVSLDPNWAVSDAQRAALPGAIRPALQLVPGAG